MSECRHKEVEWTGGSEERCLHCQETRSAFHSDHGFTYIDQVTYDYNHPYDRFYYYSSNSTLFGESITTEK